MDEHATPPQPTGGEQRTLASIMFTDVVAFSKHSAVNEERTYKALNRDFDLIYREVAAHSGQVLNTMGDGMMVVFMSAVQCVQCAIAIQGELYRQALSNPEDGVLQHRLGLHLGDIILNGKNTMGDGVNQAARIQALARPEAIAMSREFYDVVVNRTPFKAKYLGPQRAKNIHDAIPIWEISPIDDEIRQRAAEALFTPHQIESPDGATGRRSAVILIMVLLLVVLAATPIFLMRSAAKAARLQAQQEGRIPGEGKASKSAIDNLKKRLRGEQRSNPPVADNNVATESNNAPIPTSLSLNASEVSDVAAKTNNHDYAGVADVLRNAIGADSDEGKTMIKKYDDLTAFQKWLNAEVLAATEAAPLLATVIDTGQQATKALWDYKESTIVAIALAVVANPPTGTPAPPGAVGWIATFRDVHKV
jgi:class 3 adenylate cyclase